MARKRPKTLTFSALSRDPEHTVEDIVSYNAAPYDRTAKRRGGRPPGKRFRQLCEETIRHITFELLSDRPVSEIAAEWEVPVEVVEEFRRSL